MLRRTYSHFLFACLFICSMDFFLLYFNPLVFLSDAPICSTTHEELLGALKHETLTLKCEVDASPPADSFHWTFNSSGESTDLPARLHSSEVHFSLFINKLPLTFYRVWKVFGIFFLNCLAMFIWHFQTGYSRLNYTPTSDLDYGTISCWGRNAIGVQKSPCIFQIVAAGKLLFQFRISE